MKIFVTGAQGQLGQDLQKLLQKHQVVVMATDVQQLDICDLSAVKEAVRQFHPTFMINCAAYNAVDQAETDFARACLINGIGPKNLAIAAEEIGCPFMHFGTDYVFDGEKGAPYHITDQPHPVSRYGASKLLGEQMVQHACRKHYVVRLSWVFGAGNTNFPKKVIEWAGGKKELKVVTDQVSCPAYTIDIASFAWKLLQSGSYGLYHLANTDFCSRFEWARYIVDKCNLATRILPATEKDFPTPAKRPRFSAMDLFPIKEILGEDPPTWRDATDRFLLEIGART